jgi:hypothetical protein
MTARQRFRATFRDGVLGCPPLHEDLRDEVLAAWGAPDVLGGCHLDRWETGGPPGVDLGPRPPLAGVVRTEADAAAWIEAYQPPFRGELPESEVLRLTARTWPLGLSFYRGLFQSFGVTDGDTLAAHCVFLADYGDLTESMMRHLAEFTARLAEPALARLDYDFLLLGEPIASHHGPVISPAMFRRFVIPFYQRLIELARAYGVETVVWESFGQVENLLPAVLSAGVNVLCLRHAAAAGTDILALRRQLPPEIGLIGGIDGRCLLAGEEAMTAEVARVVPTLLAGGRYLPMLDDRVREGVPPERFVRYRLAVEAELRSGPTSDMPGHVREGT